MPTDAVSASRSFHGNVSLPSMGKVAETYPGDTHKVAHRRPGILLDCWKVL